MLFTSIEFCLLVIFTFTLYYLPPLRKFQLFLITLSSFFFYASNSPQLLILLLFSIGINILAGYSLLHGNPFRRKIYAIFGVCANLLVLVFFKYGTLLGATFSFPNTIEYFLISIPLPIGISFFTFQGISLVVDTFKYQDTIEYQTMMIGKIGVYSRRIAAYISFFPQLVAGPIVKAKDFLPQINEKLLKNVDWNFAFRCLVLGYFLKMVIANNLNDYTFRIIHPHFFGLSSLTLIALLLGYSFQIFSDFAGYSLIAIGIAALFGYRLKKNFDFPYISQTFSDFWSRWHISLSTFLKQYLYIPLGGNRKGPIRTYLNLFITMTLGGLWHGATWNYAVWGFFHGGLLAIERMLGFSKPNSRNHVLGLCRMSLVFCAVSLGWLLFKLTQFEHVLEYLNAIKNNLYLKDNIEIVTYILYYCAPVVLYHWFYLYRNQNWTKPLQSTYPFIYGVLLFMIVSDAGPSSLFIYFKF